MLLFLIYPNFLFPSCRLALAGARGARAAADRPCARTAAVVALPARGIHRHRLLVRHLLLDPIRPGSTWRHGTLGQLGNIRAVLCCEGAAPGALQHAGRGAAQNPLRDSGHRGALDRHRADAWNFRVRVADARQRGNRHAAATARCPVRRSLRRFVHLRPDVGGGGIADSKARAQNICTGWPSSPACCCSRICRRARTPTENALVLQPNMSEEEQWTSASAARNATT